MNIETQEKDGIAVVALEGNLDTNTVAEGEKHLFGLVEEGKSKILIDFGNLDFISSAGLRILLVTGKKMKGGGGELRICSLNEVVQEVFDISGFGTLLNVYPSKDAALESWA